MQGKHQVPNETYSEKCLYLHDVFLSQFFHKSLRNVGFIPLKRPISPTGETNWQFKYHVLFGTAVPLWGLQVGGKTMGMCKKWELKSRFFSESGCKH